MQQKNLRVLIALLTLSAVSSFASFPAQVAQGVVPKEEREEMKALEKAMTAVVKEGPRSGMVYAIKSGVVNLLKIVDVALLVGLLFALSFLLMNKHYLTIFLDKLPNNNKAALPLFFIGPLSALTFFLTAVLSQLFFYFAKDFSIVKKYKRGWLISIKGALFTLSSLSLLFLTWCTLKEGDQLKRLMVIPKNFCAVFAWNLVGYLVATFFDLLLSACYEVADLSFDLYA